MNAHDLLILGNQTDVCKHVPSRAELFVIGVNFALFVRFSFVVLDMCIVSSLDEVNRLYNVDGFEVVKRSSIVQAISD